LLTLIAIIAYGLYVLYSASGQNSGLVIRQAFRFAVGFGVIFCIILVPLRYFQKYAIIFYFLAILLLIAVLLFGTDAKGATRWLVIPGVIRLQPSELMKLASPLFLASILATPRGTLSIGWILLGLVVAILPALLIGQQPDLGTALLIGCSGLTTIFLAGLPIRYILGMLALAPPMLAVLWHFMHDYQKRRVLTLLDPSADPLGDGWNIIQSKVAIGSGGFEGKGWLNGTQSQLDFLPESSTDFIIAVIGEELGFKGILVLFGLYTFLCARGFVIAWLAPSTFGRLVAATFTFTFFIYVFVNVAMVSGLIPVVGVPLPLVSYGGSSIVSLMAGFGFIIAIHGQRKLRR